MRLTQLSFGGTFILRSHFFCVYVSNTNLSQFKFEKGWYNVIQKVETLPVSNKDKNVAAVFPIIIEHL